MLNVVMLMVVILSVVAPFNDFHLKHSVLIVASYLLLC